MQVYQHTQEPNWQPYEVFRSKMKPKEAAWVLEKGSMTKRLQKHGKESFAVRVIFHDWQNPRASEQCILSLAKNETAIIRKVELSCHNKILIYARSIYPAASMTDENHVLRHLGTRPVGEILYADSNLCRTEFEIAQLHAGHQDYQEAIKTLSTLPKQLWARRSIFTVHGKPLLISEIFLPECYEH